MSKDGFDPKDLEEICSRKRSKFHMSMKDYKELGKNAVLGTLDVALGCLGATAIIASKIPTKTQSVSIEDAHEPLSGASDGWRDGPQGYGYYRSGIKD